MPNESPPVPDAPSRLARRLGTADAVTIGLGSMIGAGVFAAIAPAARAAGNGLLLGLVVAASVAYCNATSSAQLAALYPESGGTYVYARRRLSSSWGFLAGWGFVVGKLASCAAMALTFAEHAAPSATRPVAAGAVLALTAVNAFGVRKSVALTRAIVVVVLASLTVVVAAILLGGRVDPSRIASVAGATPYGVLQAAAFLFFAFAGYARIATLGEEVIDPRRTIPRAIPIALGLTLVVYAVVAVSVLLVLDARVVAESAAPLAVAVEAGRLAPLSIVVRIGASVASLGVLLSLLLGVSRTAFSMSAAGDLPRALAKVHPRFQVPQRAEIAAGALVAATVLLADVRSAIGFSSFTVLTYYAIANASAFTLSPSERRSPRWLSVTGVVGCAALATCLPSRSIVVGASVLALGAAVRRVVPRRGSR